MTTKNTSIEIKSVSEFLEAVKQIYCDKDHQLFYRGVSKEQYATPEHDHPGIYRNKNWIDNEDKMFYELTAKCPEYFKDCKTTFEHLVMMQHYDYPTRLLDITSNPLVSLYFACGGKNGANSENNGQLISYNIKKDDIRNYESDRVAMLAILSLLQKNLHCEGFFARYIFNVSKRIIENFTKYYSEISIESDPFYTDMMLSVFVMRNIHDTMLEPIIFPQIVGDIWELYPVKDIVTFINQLINFYTVNEYSMFETKAKHYYFSTESTKEHIRESEFENIGTINMLWEQLRIIFNRYVPYSSKYLDDYYYKIKKEKDSFDTTLINSLDMRTIQCVLPKQNNPRLIAQQGAFLLFGFKDEASNKTATPIVPDEMYGKYQIITKYKNGQIIEKQQSSQKAEIIIKGSAKQKILDELKILGISNSTMFPEIDNIANELKSQYAKPR